MITDEEAVLANLSEAALIRAFDAITFAVRTLRSCDEHQHREAIRTLMSDAQVIHNTHSALVASRAARSRGSN